MTTKYIEIDRAIETALLLLEEGEDEQTLAYNAALVAFIKNMENVPATDVPRWIPDTESLPEEHEEVLTYDSVFGITYDSIRNGKWRKQPVAWMPLPTPYKGGE